MQITRHLVAEKLRDYLQHRLTLTELVDWAEKAVQEGEMDNGLAQIVGRIGVADVRAFGLTWEDCETFLSQLGYRTRVEVLAA